MDKMAFIASLAKEIGVVPSTLSRIEAGKAVQMSSFAKLLRWLFE